MKISMLKKYANEERHNAYVNFNFAKEEKFNYQQEPKSVSRAVAGRSLFNQSL
jgi:hypothetical protein